MSKARRPADYKLIALTAVLLAAGLLWLFSASALLADRQFSDPYYYLKRQLLWASLGLGLAAVLARTDYRRLREWVWPALGLTILLLVAVLFAPPVAGVRRWIRLGPLNLQPAEFAKLTALLFLADYLDRKRSKTATFAQGVLVPGAVLAALLVPIALAPDLGTPLLIFGTCLLVLFLGGTRPAHIVGTLACAAPVVAFELMRLPYRRQRLLNFLEPFSDAQGAGYQLSQALLAVGSGGWLGKGLGGSQLKLMYLPAPHTDFIFPVLCEELGLAGGLALLGLFTAFLLHGLRVARRAPDLFGTLLAAGLSLLVCLQALLNMAMSVGLLPTKGLPLPFFSYGGSSMLAMLAAVGILASVSSASHKPGRRPHR